MKNQKEKISIIGCGISTIYCAIKLIEKGYEVQIFEQKKSLGGRAGYISNKYGEIDIGQHIFLETYQNFYKIIKKFKLENHFENKRNLEIPVIDNNKKFYIKSKISFYPLSLISSVLSYKSLSFKNRLSVLYGLIKLKSLNTKNEKKIPFSFWLKQNKQNEETIKKFWEIICKPAFNISLEKFDNHDAYNLFKYMIFDPKKNISIRYSKKPILKIIEKPFKEYISKNNSKIIFEKVVKINKKNENIIIETKKNKFKSKKVIIGTNLESTINLMEIRKENIKISNSSIINIVFWFNKKVMDEDYVAFSNSDLEWVFSQDSNEFNTFSQKIIISLSDTDDLLKVKNSDLTRNFEKKIREELCINNDVKTISSLVIRSPKATQRTNDAKKLLRIKNIHFVGDWIIDKLPNTMESACLSSDILVRNEF